jgi:hypothetical protein
MDDATVFAGFAYPGGFGGRSGIELLRRGGSALRSARSRSGYIGGARPGMSGRCRWAATTARG